MESHLYKNSDAQAEKSQKGNALVLVLLVLLVVSVVLNALIYSKFQKVSRQNIELKELAVQLAVEKAQQGKSNNADVQGWSDEEAAQLENNEVTDDDDNVDLNYQDPAEEIAPEETTTSESALP